MNTSTIHSHKDLIVWQKSMDLVEAVYQLTKSFPHSELYGLTSQMRRCAVSIPSNIAEGKRRQGINEYSRFVTIAFASGSELETQLEIAQRLQFGDESQITFTHQLLLEVLKMLNTMNSSLRSLRHARLNA